MSSAKSRRRWLRFSLRMLLGLCLFCAIAAAIVSRWLTKRIRYLSLQSTQVTDDGLRHLSKIPTLRELVLSETDITDEGLVHLEKLTRLNTLQFNNTRVTLERARQLREVLPNW